MRSFSTKYYTLKPEIMKGAPKNLFYQDQKDELYISANLRLCSTLKNAHIESEKLAKEFAEAIMPKLQKRYGNDFDLRIVECSSNEGKKLIEKIRIDSEIIKKRIATGNFAGNVAP